MPKHLRTALLAAAIIATCIPVALAFPPCPRESAYLYPLDDAPEPGDAPRWATAPYGHAGTIAPLDVTVPCEPVFPTESTPGLEPKTGVCDVDVLPLNKLPLRTTTAGGNGIPAYSKAGWVGYIGLPELRTASTAAGAFQYTLTLAVNTTRLAHPGDWVDIAELGFLKGDTTERATTYRLRKLYTMKGGQVIQLIAAAPASATTTGVAFQTVIATIPLDTGATYRSLSLTWTTSVSSLAASASGGMQARPAPEEYAVDTAFELAVDATPVYASVLKQQMADNVALGVLDYHLPYPAPATSNPSPLGLTDPGRTLVFPQATFRAKAL